MWFSFQRQRRPHDASCFHYANTLTNVFDVSERSDILPIKFLACHPFSREIGDTSGNSWHVLQFYRDHAIEANVFKRYHHGFPIDLSFSGPPVNIGHCVIIGKVAMEDSITQLIDDHMGNLTYGEQVAGIKIHPQ